MKPKKNSLQDLATVAEEKLGISANAPVAPLTEESAMSELMGMISSEVDAQIKIVENEVSKSREEIVLRAAAVRAVKDLTTWKNVKANLNKQLPVEKPKLRKLQEELKSLKAQVASGYETDGVRLNPITEGHPIYARIKWTETEINRIYDNAHKWVDAIIDEKKAICESGGFFKLVDEDKQYASSQTKGR